MADEGSDGSFALLTPRRAYGSFISMRIGILIPGGDEEDKEPEPRWTADLTCLPKRPATSFRRNGPREDTVVVSPRFESRAKAH